ncbi:hypothetical protein BsWGS_22379 [Bradybaena similaris]
MVNAGVLQLFMVAMVIAERCTRAVPIQEYPAKKVHVLRRVPATCSNWDKAWAWLTKVDCGTKYRLDLVTVPSREVRQYKLQYVCCDGDTDCKEADNIHAPGFDTTDEKFLAIVLGSTAACVVIIIIIFAVTFYTKKTRCQTICDQESHVYASAEVEDVQDPNSEEKRQPEDVEGEKEYKCCDAEYAEICDSRLPRYTDIFKDSVDEKGNPFNKATAPPMYSAVNPKEYINTLITATAPLKSSDDTQIVSGASLNLNEGVGADQNPRSASVGLSDQENNEAGVLYYNVDEELKEKKRKGECASVTKGDIIDSKRDKNTTKGEARVLGNTASISLRINNKKGKNNLPNNMEMMVKSSSASETIGKMSETVLTKQKRRSAPPGSIDASEGYAYGNQGSSKSASSSSVSRSNSNSACRVIHENTSGLQKDNDKRSKTKSSRENLQQNPVRKTSHGSNSSQIGSSLRKSSSHNLSSNRDLKSSGRSVSPPKGASSEMTSDDSECTHPTENDSLLRSSSCHSGCGDDCEHCYKYDRIGRRPDPDTASLHIYQCLDEVKKECEALRAASAVEGLKNLGLETSVINNGSSESLSKTTDPSQVQC